MIPSTPRWEQRIRAPQIVPFSLIGAAISWADKDSDRGVLLATRSGRAEVYSFDPATSPASLRQVTDRPQGTLGGAISNTASHVLWFDDHGGDEVGRWVREPFDGSSDGPAVVLAPNLPPAYNAGVIAHAVRTFLGRLTDTGLELAVADKDGSATSVVQFTEPGQLVAVNDDETVALVSFAPAGDWLHPGVRLVDLLDGAIVAELVDPGRALTPVGFAPAASDPRILITHERSDRSGVMLWDPSVDTTCLLTIPLDGDLSAQWWPGHPALLVASSALGRDTLHRYEFADGSTALVATPVGTVYAASPRPDGRVMTLISDSATPPTLVWEGKEPIVDLGGPALPPSVTAQDVFAEGPGGRVHALLLRPEGAPAPHPTVFLVHGGPTAQDLDSFNIPAAALVDAGYAVVRVNYRGSTGYGAEWRNALRTRLGFTELEDIAAVRSQLEATGIIDTSSVAVAGGSWGGYVTLFALGVEPDRWRCGAALVPLADWFVACEDQPPFMTAYDNALMGGTIQEIPDAYRIASPITYVDSVKAPLFITAGANDPRCPPRQSDGYVERLRSRGHDVTYQRWDSGHALFDADSKSREVGAILQFLLEKMPPSRTS